MGEPNKRTMGACGGSKDQKQAKSPRNESDPSAAGGGSQEHKPEPKMCSVKSEKLALGVMTNFNDAEIEALKKRFDEVATLGTSTFRTLLLGCLCSPKELPLTKRLNFHS